MIPHGARDANAPGRTLGLQPGCHVDAIAVKIGAVGDHVGDVDADTKTDAPIRRLVAVMDWHLLLHLDGTAHGAVDAVEYDQQRIAPGLDDPAAMLADRGIDQACRSARSRWIVPASSRPIRRL